MRQSIPYRNIEKSRVQKIHVTEPINAFSKLALESEFQLLSPGGAISYIEVPNMQNNIEAILDVIKFMYSHIIYSEINCKSDFCM